MDAQRTVKHLRQAIAAIENGDSTTARVAIERVLDQINDMDRRRIHEPFATTATCSRVACPVCGGPEENEDN